MSTDVKRLYRSRSDRMLAGVCAGIGEYLNIDPTVVRLLFVATALLGGPGFIVYLVMWIIVPEEPLAKDTVVTGSAEPIESEE
jgi:phage shock protein PspC (stress-responsive transcriptional regulator)